MRSVIAQFPGAIPIDAGYKGRIATTVQHPPSWSQAFLTVCCTSWRWWSTVPQGLEAEGFCGDFFNATDFGFVVFFFGM